MAATISTTELLEILKRGDATIGRFCSTRAGRALVTLVAPSGRTRDVTVAD
jgi:hypothetical protein